MCIRDSVSADQRVRKEAFEAYHGTFQNYLNTIAALYAGSVKLDDYYTRARGYDLSLIHI